MQDSGVLVGSICNFGGWSAVILNPELPSTRPETAKMRWTAINLLRAMCLVRAGVSAQEAPDGCPKDELACHDIMNSSQCIEQLVIEKLSPLTREAMVKCVEHEGTASNLPGAVKVSDLPLLVHPLS